jgi:hypothetical protein
MGGEFVVGWFFGWVGWLVGRLLTETPHTCTWRQRDGRRRGGGQETGGAGGQVVEENDVPVVWRGGQ